MKEAHVILLLYDTNRIYTLKSLENWVKVATEKDWIKEHSLVILVSNKTDLQAPNDDFVEEVRTGIVHFINAQGVQLSNDQVISRYSSCKDNTGIKQIRGDIAEWIAVKGIGNPMRN